ncbi:hypothetical protein B296_00043289 [Ensete ventricosum]|uniref:Uncharacterized protein n=1 Tax=Ensete ventricosum TaxID=4639 RepID=A0A426WZU9_ENSVE|nr:hypothetical protein B296_00043289 [Ensete ventricosum]
MSDACLLLGREICTDEERVSFKAEEAEDVHDTNLSSDRMTFFPEETWSGSSTEMGLVAFVEQSLLVNEVRLPAREGVGVCAGWLSGGRDSKAPRDDGQRLLSIAASSEGTSLARRGDTATVGKIDIDLVLVLVQHNGSGSGKEEDPSLHVGEKGQR